MKRKFVDKPWILCIPVPIVLWIHLSTQGKPDFIQKKLIVDQLLHHIQTKPTKTFFLATKSRSLKAWTTIILHGHSFDNFVAFVQLYNNEWLTVNCINSNKYLIADCYYWRRPASECWAAHLHRCCFLNKQHVVDPVFLRKRPTAKGTCFNCHKIMHPEPKILWNINNVLQSPNELGTEIIIMHLTVIHNIQTK